MNPTPWIRNPSDDAAVREGCWFDPQAGDFVCAFVETFCRQSKGRWAGLPLRLLDWQRDFVHRLYGWKRPDGLRRFRRFYLEIAKKNGKSTLLSAISLQNLVCEIDGAPEIYINACDRSQASIIHDEAERMVRASPDLSRRLKVKPSVKRILCPANSGVLIANSRVADSKDGLNPSLTIFDELHRQPGRQLWDVFEYASLAREQPLFGAITTAGEECSGVWWEQRDYSEKVNAGIISDTSHLGIVYRADEGDDVSDPATWLKANPSLGHTIRLDDFRSDLAKASQSPAKMANFLRLRLNIVSNADRRFLDLEKWDHCA